MSERREGDKTETGRGAAETRRPGPGASAPARRPTQPGPRVLLRRLREVMADQGAADVRLGQVVRLIAANMVAEVCSIYLLRPGQQLELMATEGLRAEAVHLTRLRVGEGLVGDIAATARPLALADAHNHPLFVYRPETGEEIYQSFLGVPVLRGGKAIGVLVVQNRTRRQYEEEEIEALETTAMVLAELVASGRVPGIDDPTRTNRASLGPMRIEGRTLAEGVATGRAALHEPRVEIRKTLADDVGAEKLRLEAAIASMRDEVDRLAQTEDLPAADESRDVLEAYRMFANDRGWLKKLHEAVDSGLTAEAAVLRVQTDTRYRMNAITDPYLRERLADLEDLANRLLQHLSGRAPGEAVADLPDGSVLVARSMGPAELLDYDRRKLQAVVLEEGSAASHVAIVARALGLPLIGGCEGVVDKVEPGDQIIVDADHKQIFLRPGEDVLKAFRLNYEAREARQAKYAEQRSLPAVTKDGQDVAMLLNAGLLVDLAQLDETRADGIGLYRTELHFMVRSSFPKVEVQTDLYAKVLDAAGERQVVFRTLDVGGDKPLPYLAEPDEENPAMGWRAIRISLDRPALLRSQVRALLLAAAGRKLSIMFPMVAEVDEFTRAKAMVDAEIGRLAETDRPVPSELRLGTMIEVPSLAWSLPALLPQVDFVSIGSNDLMQFFFAADRGNPKVGDRYDPLSPAALGFLRWIQIRCAERNVPVNFCGEMAGRPLEALALLGLGYRRLSMPAAATGAVKEMVRSVDIRLLEEFLLPLLKSGVRTLRPQLAQFAETYCVPV